MQDDLVTVFPTHPLRHPSAKKNDEFVFGARRPQYILDLIVTSYDAIGAGISWALGEALRKFSGIF